MNGGVLLIVMPFAGVERPQLGVSTLKTKLQEEGIPCHVLYLNIAFAEAVDYDTYKWISDNYSFEVFAGEWLFATSLFSDKEINYDAYIHNILAPRTDFTPALIQLLLRMAQIVEPFLEHCIRTIPWYRYSIVGFTSTFEQNLASLALAKRIKRKYPDKVVVMGGGNCAGPMGLQLHKNFSYLDYVFTGEAENSFPELVRRLANGDSRRDDIRGYVRRENGKSLASGPGLMLQNLDALPYPNFDDFFDQYRCSALSRKAAPILQIESARGCWWGAKQHCTFCGLNGDEMAFRAKSPERALDEIQHLVNRYDTNFVSAVDNILAMGYFKTLLPELKRRKAGIELFYETKANLTREQVNLLRESGVTHIQPGIESFSDSTLRLIRKGVSGLQNAQLLKWCKLYNVLPQWNLIYGFPGENSSDYAANLEFVRSLQHFYPPMGSGPLRLDRFSPYFDHPEQFGIRSIRAMRPYRYLYPFDDSILYNIAYFFDYDFDGKNSRDEWFKPILAELEIWQQNQNQYSLEELRRIGDTVWVRDTRPHRVRDVYQFSNRELSVIDFCFEVRHIGQILSHIEETGSGHASELWLRRFLTYLTSHRLMIGSEDRYLSLIMPPHNQLSPAQRR